MSKGHPTNRTDHTFVWVVKIWFEEPPSEDSRLFWRGHARDVMTTNEVYFQTLEELLEFIENEIAQ